MLEALDLTCAMPREEYKRELPRLQKRLHRLQRACWEGRVGTIVVLEGWDASGKGKVIHKLTQKLEPRRFTLSVVREPRSWEMLLPWMRRFWAELPNWGELAIFDRSWYWEVVGERVENGLDDDRWHTSATDIRSFERTLAEDRYVVVKFFLHISREEQERRFQAFGQDPEWAWRLEGEDWKHHERYGDYRVAFEEMLERTESEWGPWTLVAATDRYWTRWRVFTTLIQRLEEALEQRELEVPEPEAPDEDEDRDCGGC